MKKEPRQRLILKWSGITLVIFAAFLYQAGASVYIQLGQYSEKITALLLSIPGIPSLASIQPSATIPGTSWNWSFGITLILFVVTGLAFQRLIHHRQRLQVENEARDLQNI